LRYMKSLSCKRLKENFEFIKKVTYAKGRIWSRGCCVSTLRLSEELLWII
jgi:hypothetical protein